MKSCALYRLSADLAKCGLADSMPASVVAAVREGRKPAQPVDQQVIVLGSTTMHQAHGYLAAHLDVPVINPGPLSYKLAEAMLCLGLTHSRRAYPASPAPKHGLIHGFADQAE